MQHLARFGQQRGTAAAGAGSATVGTSRGPPRTEE